MAHKLFSTGPGTFRRAKRKKAIDGFDRTSCDSLFHSEMVLGENKILTALIAISICSSPEPFQNGINYRRMSDPNHLWLNQYEKKV